MADTQFNALPRGRELDGYRFEAVLGSGAFGITYRARELSIGRQVAVKEYLPTGFAMRARDGVRVQPINSRDEDEFAWGLVWFRKEAETLIACRHPNVVTVHRFFEANGTAYLVMDYEPGASLASILRKPRMLEEAALRLILIPFLDGLAQVHRAEYLHRDIKPENIYLRADGSPVLLDFGGARQALGAKDQSLASLISAGYAPYEQYAAQGDQGPWTDIYSVGAVVYRAITGTRPPDATDRTYRLLQGAQDPLRPAVEVGRARYGEDLLHAVDFALAIKPEDRPQSVAEFRWLLSQNADWEIPPRVTPGASQAPLPRQSPPARAPGPTDRAKPTPPPGTPPPPLRPVEPVPPAAPRPRPRIGAAAWLALAAILGTLVWLLVLRLPSEFDLPPAPNDGERAAPLEPAPKLSVPLAGAEPTPSPPPATAPEPAEPAPAIRSGPPEVLWQRSFGGSRDDRANAIAALADGGVAVAGKTSSKGAGSGDAWVMRLDGDGRLTWDRTFGGPAYERANSIVAIPATGFAVAGHTASKGAGERDGWLLRLDRAGQVIWDRTIGGLYFDSALSVVALPDGGFVVAGYTAPSGGDDQDAWFARLDRAGKTVWERTVGGAGYDGILGMTALAGGGFVAVGETGSGGAGRQDALVIRIGPRGDVLWRRVLGGAANDWVRSVVALGDGGVVLAGVTASKGAGGEDAWIVRLDAAGGVVWEQTLGGAGDDRANAVVALADGGFVFAGFTASGAGGRNDGWIVRLDGSGKLRWEMTVDGPLDNRLNAIAATADGGLVAAGQARAQAGTGNDAWIVRLGYR